MNYKIKLNKKGTGLNLYHLIKDSGKSKTEIAEFLNIIVHRSLKHNELSVQNKKHPILQGCLPFEH